MTRTEFIKAYAKNSNLSDEATRFAPIGVLEMQKDPQTEKDWMMVAMPCACGANGCPGWAMLNIETIAHHFEFHAPWMLRTAYKKAVEDAGGE